MAVGEQGHQRFHVARQVTFLVVGGDRIHVFLGHETDHGHQLGHAGMTAHIIVFQLHITAAAPGRFRCFIFFYRATPVLFWRDACRRKVVAIEILTETRIRQIVRGLGQAVLAEQASRPQAVGRPLLPNSRHPMSAAANLPLSLKRKVHRLLRVDNPAPDELALVALLLEDEGVEDLLGGLGAGYDGHHGVEIGTVKRSVELPQTATCTYKRQKELRKLPH